MKVSVLIAAYNCATKIQATLDSVFQQTLKPCEILVMNDGSTDETAAVLEAYKPQITIYSQPNQGLASARNELLLRTKGDLIAFLDSDDIWHPKYLEVQSKIFRENPDVAAAFAGHVNFYGDKDYVWESDPLQEPQTIERIPALDFFKRYNHATGSFSCFSYCCVPLKVLQDMGKEPFRETGAEDSYCFSVMALSGRPFILASADLVAYRIHAKSMSQNHFHTFGVWVRVFERLEEQFKKAANGSFQKAFQMAFAAKRRAYAKFLLGNGKIEEARDQLRKSLANNHHPVSLAKSLGVLGLSYLPRVLQPKWPSGHREWKERESLS